jgi:hypothetical protein
LKPVKVEGNLIVVDIALWRDEGGKQRRKDRKELLASLKRPATSPPDPA